MKLTSLKVTISPVTDSRPLDSPVTMASLITFAVINPLSSTLAMLLSLMENVMSVPYGPPELSTLWKRGGAIDKPHPCNILYKQASNDIHEKAGAKSQYIIFCYQRGYLEGCLGNQPYLLRSQAQRRKDLDFLWYTCDDSSRGDSCINIEVEMEGKYLNIKLFFNSVSSIISHNWGSCMWPYWFVGNVRMDHFHAK